MTDCPKPRRMASGDFTCSACGRIWDFPEEGPDCAGVPDAATQRANYELDQLRQLLDE